MKRLDFIKAQQSRTNNNKSNNNNNNNNNNNSFFIYFVQILKDELLRITKYTTTLRIKEQVDLEHLG